MQPNLFEQTVPILDGMVNPSVLPEDEIRLSGQNFKVFDLLKQGPATNIELQKRAGGLAIHSRISDVRQELQKYGWNLKKIGTGEHGSNTYAIITPTGKVYPKDGLI